MYINGTTRCTTHVAVGNITLMTYRENTPINGSGSYTGWWINRNQDTTTNYYDRINYKASVTAVGAMPTEEFDARAAMLNERYKAADDKLTKLKAEREDHLTRGKGIRRFLSALDGQPQNLDDWDEQAWNLLVSRVIIRRNGCVEFVFRGEITITVRAE